MRSLPKLSPRLKKILEFVQPGQAFWDLGCDHGYLGYHLYQQRLVTEVHFVDSSPHVIWNLKHRFTRFMEEQGEELECPPVFFHCEKAERLDSRQIHGTVVIAGVGMSTVLSILKVHLPKMESPSSWILCPQTGEANDLEDFLNFYPNWVLENLGKTADGTRQFSIFRLGKTEVFLAKNRPQNVPVGAVST